MRTTLTVAEAVTLSPLDQGTILAGHHGLEREILWADIMHAPAHAFIRTGDLVLTTGADPRENTDRAFLAHLIKSAAAGMILSPPPDANAKRLLPSLISLANEHKFPVLLLPWKIAFADVMRALLPRLSPTRPELHTQLAVGHRKCNTSSWAELAEQLTQVLPTLAERAGMTVTCSATENLILTAFTLGPASGSIQDVIGAAERLSATPESLCEWEFFLHETTSKSQLSPSRLASGPLVAKQFVETLRHHPQSMAAVTHTLSPLLAYDEQRGGQLVHTLDVLMREGANVSSAARELFLNRHSLLYRVKLIEELTGLSIKSSADRFLLEVSVRVHQTMDQ